MEITFKPKEFVTIEYSIRKDKRTRKDYAIGYPNDTVKLNIPSHIESIKFTIKKIPRLEFPKLD